MPFNLGLGEVIVVLVVALLVFGKRLPEVGRSLGRGLVEFKEGLKGAAAEMMSEKEPDKEPEQAPEDHPDPEDHPEPS
jgi:sec-independent protein translocase protein TatA